MKNSSPRLVDLSHRLEHGQPGYPGDPSAEISPWATLADAGYNVAKITLSTHQGTHVDAPYHFFPDGKAVCELPLAPFFGPAALVDLAPGGMLPAQTPITLGMLLTHAAKFTSGARVICRTGWHQQYNMPGYYRDYPSLGIDAAQWIAGRKIALLGIDTPSVGDAECHRALLARDAPVVILENLANVDQLPERFTLIAFPLPLGQGDGSPVRAVAVLD